MPGGDRFSKGVDENQRKVGFMNSLSQEIPWRLGVEVELIAPPGKSRLDLATSIAEDCGGTVRRFFHVQSEPSKVPGTTLFYNLTQGFKVIGSTGEWVASCVDDLTLQADFRRDAAPKPGWYRILSDDSRLLRLIEQQVDPDQRLEGVLDPICRLFGTQPNPGPGGMVKINDITGASVAIAAPLPGERERPCELVTSPIDTHHRSELERFLKLARCRGFSAPVEGATHLHFDATDLQTAPAIANLIEILSVYGDTLKAMLRTNPNCSRLGAWPSTLLEAVRAPDFRTLRWEEARSRLFALNLSKFCDFNLVNCLHPYSAQNTIEVRVLPTHLSSEPIVRAAALLVAIFARAKDTDLMAPPSPFASPPSPGTLLDWLPLPEEQRAYWL